MNVICERFSDYERRLAELRAEIALCNGTIDSRDRNIEELTAQVERLEKDAERYQFLRNPNSKFPDNWGGLPWHEALDRAIDAAASKELTEQGREE